MKENDDAQVLPDRQAWSQDTLSDFMKKRLKKDIFFTYKHVIYIDKFSFHFFVDKFIKFDIQFDNIKLLTNFQTNYIVSSIGDLKDIKKVSNS